MANNNDLVVVRFRQEVTPDEPATKAAGAPKFKALDVVEIRFAANRQTVGVFPANDAEPNATREQGRPVSYKEVYADQWAKYQALQEQDVAGTPIRDLPFLTEPRRRELRAINIHTAEALSQVGGQALKQLGQTGSAEKAQAQAYLEKAAGSADVTAMAATIEELKQMIADQNATIKSMGEIRQPAPPPAPTPAPVESVEMKPLDQFTDDELKAYIRENGGTVPRGNAGHDTLLNAALAIAEKAA